MIYAENLVKTFSKNEKKNKKRDINAVDGISLSVKSGEIVGILGPNGAGKTTLLRMLARLMKPTCGEVRIETGGKIIDSDLEIKRCIGYLSENTKLYRRLTTREHLSILGEVYGLTEKETEDKINEITEVLSMEDFIDNRIEKLSTGQTQRASIARCLIHSPLIYIFDEPTLGLDIISSSAIIEFMKNEKKKGKTVIYSTHYMEEAEYLCDRIIMINGGKIIKEGTPEELKKETGAGNMREVFYGLMAGKELLI